MKEAVSFDLCGNFFIPGRVQSVQHEEVGIQTAGGYHLKNSGRCTGNQNRTGFMHGDGLTGDRGTHIPEYNLRQDVAVFRKEPQGVLIHGFIRTIRAGIELHIGDDVQC